MAGDDVTKGKKPLARRNGTKKLNEFYAQLFKVRYWIQDSLSSFFLTQA